MKMSSLLIPAAFAALLLSCGEKPDVPIVDPPAPADGPVAIGAERSPCTFTRPHPSFAKQKQ